jgi:hypothetical protein
MHSFPNTVEKVIRDLISDPIVRLLMSADNVDEERMMYVLASTARNLERSATSSVHRRIQRFDD